MREKKPFSLLLLILLLSGFCSYHIYYYCLNEKKSELVDNYYTENNNRNNSSQQIVEKIRNNTEEYLGILKVPKINLELGFYNIDSKMNNVNQNIVILKESLMPDKYGGTIYFAAHSGNSYLGYFHNIDKLELNDQIIINYQGKNYYYTINDMFEMDKNGIITINKNIHENYVVLTTCSKKQDKQLIITGKLVNKV